MRISINEIDKSVIFAVRQECISELHSIQEELDREHIASTCSIGGPATSWILVYQDQGEDSDALDKEMFVQDLTERYKSHVADDSEPGFPNVAGVMSYHTEDATIFLALDMDLLSGVIETLHNQNIDLTYTFGSTLSDTNMVSVGARTHQGDDWSAAIKEETIRSLALLYEVSPA